MIAKPFSRASFVGRLYARNFEPDSPTKPENGAPEAIQLAANLMLRLANETFISLPIKNCNSIVGPGSAGTSSASERLYDACFVDWKQAKLVQESTHNGSDETEHMLSSIMENSGLDEHGDTPLPSANSSSRSIIKLTYLTTSSLLSLCGILINLFILLIIIFNTKQKRSSVIRFTNMSQNKLLLVQLTLTGLLLTSYVLIDNINTRWQNKLPQWDYLSEEPRSFCPSSAQSRSPLSTFLPPTSFELDTVPCSVLGRLDCQLDDNLPDQTNRIERPQTDFAVVMGLKQLPSSVKVQPKSLYVDFIFDDQFSELIEVTDPIETIFVANSNCRSNDARQARSMSVQQDSCRASRLSAFDLIQLLMNVIASVNIWTVAALAYDRYSAIAHPLRYLRSLHISRTWRYFAISWAIALVFNLLLPVLLDQIVSLGSDPLPSVADAASYNECQSDLLSINDRQFRLTTTLVKLASESMFIQQKGTNSDRERAYEIVHTVLLLSYSLFGFIVIILLPLLIIAICNISIYKIVKVHERRLSLSSGSTVVAPGSNLSINRRRVCLSATMRGTSSIDHYFSQPGQCLKRKLCDLRPQRKSFRLSQFEYPISQRNSEADTCSYIGSTPTIDQEQSKVDSSGLMSQLKMAGLSFAGIAIQELSAGVYRRSMNKSSSYSFGSLAMPQSCWSGAHNNTCASESRYSMESVSSISCPKKSYVSLNATASEAKRYSTRLLDGYSDSLHQGHARLPVTIGTKSPAFNVVIWLILTMLIFALPHYILVTVYQIRQLNDLNPHRTQMSSLATMIRSLMGPTGCQQAQGNLLHEAGSASSTALLRKTSVWLSCLCRVLFLSLVPLNGWLYGVRSRYLAATMKMFLKRYISTKQASIEITQRQRSISSIRSRDSSFANLSNPYNGALLDQLSQPHSFEVKKSTSEFKFFITTADHQHQVYDYQPERSELVRAGPQVVLNAAGDPKTARSVQNWFGQLRQRFLRLFSHNSPEHLAEVFESNDGRKARLAKDQDGLKEGADFECMQDQCRVALLRRSSIEGASCWRSTELANAPDKTMSSNQKLRSSLTMNSLETRHTASRAECFKNETCLSATCCCRKEGPATAASKMIEHDSTAHLKQPSFLRLIFETGNKADKHAYTNCSALSPIKECSSNHSYASSQSSLNYPNQYGVQR